MHVDIKSINYLENLDFFAKQVVEGFITGLHKSPFHGFSVEFAEHRIYNQGESIKNVDWKLFARTDKMFVKRYVEETNLRCHLVIDSSSSMFFPFNEKKSIDKLTFSILSSACLMNLFMRQRDAFGVTLFSESLDFHRNPKASKKHYFQLIYELEKKLKTKRKTSIKTDFSKSISSLVDLVKERSLIVIFSDFQGTEESLNNLFQSIQNLKYNKHEVILFHVTDLNFEKDLEFSRGFYKFIDLETNEEINLNPSEIKKQFQLEKDAFFSLIKEKASKNKIDYYLADLNMGFHQMLKSYLIKRTKLY
tara:strand:- start:24141 stop:25058 length:918 start_codon:yes stop_codon:yes gene_type:complete